MRIAVLAAVIALLAWPAMAQASNVHSFGSATCRQKVPCLNSDTSQQLSTADLASAASACVTQYFGDQNPNGFFDDLVGLDGSGCLTPKPGAMSKGIGEQLTPICCVVPLNDSSNSCVFHCDLVTGK